MALEMRAVCERCETPLGHGGDARICSFECTFCPDCAEQMQHTLPELRRRAGGAAAPAVTAHPPSGLG